MSNPVEALVERLCKFNCDVESAGECDAHVVYRASLRPSPEVETLITRFDELAEHDAGCLRFHSSTDGACDCRIAALRADLLASLRGAPGFCRSCRARSVTNLR